jgi:hypothetical protein
VIYALPDDRAFDLYVGQQMDVYMKAATRPAGINLDAAGTVGLPFDDQQAPDRSSERAKTKATEASPSGPT